ncbi:MAG: tyrosine-protein phosphatase [Bacteroidales bacterium]|nr:tyrosine-protein phosphatase [Bacteroidales bacterium]
MKKFFYGLMCLSVLLVSCNKNKDTTREPFQGDDITHRAEIVMDKNTKVANLNIDTKGRWFLFSGSSVDSIDFVTPLLNETGSGTYKLAVPGNRRTYYFLETEDGTAFLAERQLPMAGGFNFRDLGGIRNKDGKYTKWGKIFRSDDMHNLTPEDLTYLASIPIVSVVDFRSGQEIEANPDVLPASVRHDYAYSITPGDMTMNMDSIGTLQSADLDEMMKQMNVLFVTDSAYYNRYKDFFALLMNDSNVPLMFHCTAGKDRTGMAAALVLSALNVDESVIMEDYLSSNKYLEDKYRDIKNQYPALKSLLEVKPEFLQAGLDQMKRDHGSVENFLRNVLGVDIERFQAMYLY